MRLFHLAVTMGLIVGGGAFAYAQDRWGDDEYRDGQNRLVQYANRAYEDGVIQGQRDRANNFPYSYKTPEWRYGDKNYRQAYRDGYEQGYRGYGSYGNNSGPAYGDRNSPYSGNYPYDRGYRSYGNQGYERGFQDGIRDGQRDQVTGHSYRPTHSDNYEDADRGYNSSFGDKKYYKQEYRGGYLQGYQEGYGYRAYRR